MKLKSKIAVRIEFHVFILDDTNLKIGFYLFSHALIIHFFFFTSDITKLMGTIYYLGEFDNGNVRFFKSNEVKNVWPGLIIEYLEPLIEF